MMCSCTPDSTCSECAGRGTTPPPPAPERAYIAAVGKGVQGANCSKCSGSPYKKRWGVDQCDVCEDCTKKLLALIERHPDWKITYDKPAGAFYWEIGVYECKDGDLHLAGGDRDVHYQFGHRPTPDFPYPFGLGQLKRLLIFRGRVQDGRARDV